MATRFGWVIVRELEKRPEKRIPIGAVGFIGVDGNGRTADSWTAVVVVAFHLDADADRDGKVSFGEWLATKASPIGVGGSAVAHVAMQAMLNERVLMLDNQFRQFAGRLLVEFAHDASLDALFRIYVLPALGPMLGSAASCLASGIVKEWVVRKGFEKAVKAAWDSAVKQRDPAPLGAHF
jgi:hypothetical protein